VLVLTGSLLMAQTTGAFKSSQLKYKKVKDAYDTKWPGLQKELKEKDVDAANYEVFIRAF